MEITKRLSTNVYSTDQIAHLEEFCNRCDSEGYQNNKSLAAMKLDWCLSIGGQFFLTYLDNAIISVSGCHPLPEIDQGTYRMVFRGATLNKYQNIFNIVSKTHMNSIPFLYHMPKQIDWAKEQGYDNFVITTNIDNTNIPSMNKSHSVLNSLSRQGLVECIVDKKTLFYSEQSVWKLNVEKINKIRTEFKTRHRID